MAPGRIDFEALARAGYAAGLTPDMFWSLTPHEAGLFIASHQTALGDRRAWHRDLEITGAWMTANLTRARRLPLLARLLRPKANILTGKARVHARADHADLVRRLAPETLRRT